MARRPNKKFVKSGNKVRRKFSTAFKRNAMEVLAKGEKSLVAVARDLGIRRNLLQSWKAKYSAPLPTPGKAVREVNYASLKNKIGSLEAENDMLRDKISTLQDDADLFKTLLKKAVL